MRLVTRSDFDGLGCAALLNDVGIIDQYLYTHPKDLQDGIVEITKNDVLANVPYVEGCGMWFDHHSSEDARLDKNLKYKGLSKAAPSCARVVWDYYQGKHTFPPHFEKLVQAVDKSDSAALSDEEIRNPQGWVLLGFIMDPRTGLGRIHDFRISNFELMKLMPGYMRTHNAMEMLEIPDVRERVEVYRREEGPFMNMLQKRCSTYKNLAVLDLREQDPIHAGNRFLLYSLFPECNISLTMLWGFRKQNVVFSVGHSILNKTSRTDVGALMLEYGGGGHTAVGTCQVDADRADEVLKELIARITDDG